MTVDSASSYWILIPCYILIFFLLFWGVKLKIRIINNKKFYRSKQHIMLKSKINKAAGFEKSFENIGSIVYGNSTSASKGIARETIYYNIIRLNSYHLTLAHYYLLLV